MTSPARRARLIGRAWTVLVVAGLLVGLLASPARAGALPLERISRGASGAGMGGGFGAVVSADGRFVAFVSAAIDLVPGQQDVNGTTDVFLHDRWTGTTTLVSRTPDSAVTAGDGESLGPSLSADGRLVAFFSAATNLVPGQVDVNADYDVFLYDRLDQATALLSRAAGSAATSGNAFSWKPVVSADGELVAFTSLATDLVAGQVDLIGTSDVFLHSRSAGTLTLVSRTSASALTAGDHGSDEPALSADGRFVAFRSAALGLVTSHVDPNGVGDVFVYDRLARTTILVSHVPGLVSTAGGGESSQPAVSAEGRFVAFTSDAPNLVPGQLDANGGRDVFLHDMLTGTTTLVSRTAASPVIAANGESFGPVLSGDGRFVAYVSAASDLVEGQSDVGTGIEDADVFLYDRELQTTTLVSRTAASAVTGGGGAGAPPSISADGRLVAFFSAAPDLVDDQLDANGELDVFLHDQATGRTSLLSRAGSGALRSSRGPTSSGAAGSGASAGPVLASGGAVVVFSSLAPDLANDDDNAAPDVFAWPRPCTDRPGSPACRDTASRP